jgi:hypothetical protein
VGVPISARRTELGSAAGGWVREPRGGAKGTPEALDRVGPGRGGATTLAEFVEEYLELHQAEPVTIAKLRWLLGKATDTLGEKRVADLSLKDVYAWHLTVPEGHRFEATQALRQVFNRAVAWGMLDFNPAKRGVPNTQRRPKEKRPFESWAQIEAIAARLGTVYGPMWIFGAGDRASTLGAVRARATRRRPRAWRRLCAAWIRERQDQKHQDPAEHARGPPAGEGG